jgi:hypothetical protein
MQTYTPPKELQCESALNKLKRKVPFGWDLNIYRGCSTPAATATRSIRTNT